MFLRSEDPQTIKNMLASLFQYNEKNISPLLILPFDNMGETIYNFFRMIGDQFAYQILFRESVPLVWMLIGLSVVWFFPNTNEIMKNYHSLTSPIKQSRGRSPSLPLPEFLKNILVFQPNIKWAIIIGTLGIISLTFMTRIQRFIYSQS